MILQFLLDLPTVPSRWWFVPCTQHTHWNWFYIINHCFSDEVPQENGQNGVEKEEEPVEEEEAAAPEEEPAAEEAPKEEEAAPAEEEEAPAKEEEPAAEEEKKEEEEAPKEEETKEGGIMESTSLWHCIFQIT